jgi:hypothetical protein
VADVTKFPRSKREHPGADACLTMVTPYDPKVCRHSSFIIDPSAAEVTCGKCGTKLSPMWVLNYLATEETGWDRTRKACAEERKRLDERSRTKCQHCQRMTRISR